MKWLSTILIGIGFASLLQAEIVMSAFLSESRNHLDAADIGSVQLSVASIRTGQMVSSAVGSIAGCFGVWFLLLFLKTRRLERQIAELREQVQRDKCGGPLVALMGDEGV